MWSERSISAKRRRAAPPRSASPTGRASSVAPSFEALGVGLLVLALSVVACRPSEAPASPTPPPDAVAQAAPFARWLPEQTRWTIWTPNVTLVTDAWLPEGGALSRRLGLWLLELGGENLLSRDARERVGLAPDGCAGSAAIGERGQTTVSFACLSDADRFTREVLRLWKPLDAQVGAELLDDGWALLSGESGSVAVLVRPSLALLLHDGQGAPVRAVAQSIASLPPERSVAATAEFIRLMRELPAGDLHAYVDAGALARGALGLAPDLQGRTSADATAELERSWQSALERAMNRGEPEERLLAIDDDFRARRRQIRDDSDARTVRAWVGRAGPLGVALDLRPNGLAARVLWLMAEDADIASVVRSSAAAVETARSVAQKPALFVHANLDAERVGKLVDYLLSREPSAEPEAPVTRLWQRFREQWTGAFGLVCLPSTEGEAHGPLMLRAEVELRDGGAVRQALDRTVAEQASGPIVSVPGEQGRYWLEVPGAGRWDLSVDDRRLVVLAGGGPRSRSAAPHAASRWAGTGARVMQRLAEAPGSALVAAVDVGLVRGIADALGRAAQLPAPSAPSDEAAGASGVAPAEADDAIAAPSAALAGAVPLIAGRIAAIDDRLQGPRPWTAPARAANVGVVGLRLAPDRVGWGLELVWVAATRSISDALDPWVKQLMDDDARGADPFEPLWQERDALEAERERLIRRASAPSQGGASEEPPGMLPPEAAAPAADGNAVGKAASPEGGNR